MLGRVRVVLGVAAPAPLGRDEEAALVAPTATKVTINVTNSLFSGCTAAVSAGGPSGTYVHHHREVFELQYQVEAAGGALYYANSHDGAEIPVPAVIALVGVAFQRNRAQVTGNNSVRSDVRKNENKKSKMFLSIPFLRLSPSRAGHANS